MSVCYRVSIDMVEPIVVELHAESEEDLDDLDNDDLVEVVLERDPGFRIVQVAACGEEGA